MSDVMLTIGINPGSLQQSIQKEIKSATKTQKTVELKASAGALKKSINEILSDANVKKISIGVNKTEFLKSVNGAIQYASGVKNKPKLQIDVDKAYLKQQIDAAIKGIGSAKTNVNNGTTKITEKAAESSSAANNAASKALAEEAKQANLLNRAYSELNRVRNASRLVSPETAEQAVGLRNNAIALRTYIDQYKSGQINIDVFKSKLSGLIAENSAYIDSAKEAGQYANQLGLRLQRMKMHLTSITSIVRAFYMLRMVLQPVVNAVTEVDSAMTQLKIVTQASNDEIERYSKNIMDVADKTAGSVKDLINSTTTFSRLGYTIEESTDLAKYTQMLENVGDIDEEPATKAITAIVKAFNLGMDDIESAMDKMVYVGNNFPISVSEIAEGMNNAGSMLSMATSGNLEQSIALLTAANTTIQNVSKSSTGLRTIAARIRNVKADLDDLGETMTEVEYDDIVKTITRNGVSLTDESGELRNIYDILSDLSDVWKTLSDNEQAALAKTLSGTRQQNVFASLMNNFSEASTAMQKMHNSEGEMVKANEKVLDSAQAHIQRLKNAFVEFSQSAVSAETIKNFADFTKVLLDIVSGILRFINSIGGLKTVLPLIFSLFSIFKGEAVLASLTRMSETMRSFGTIARNTFQSLMSSARNFGTTMTSTATTTVSASQAITSALGAIGLAITAAQIVISLVQSAIDEANQQLQSKIESGVKAAEEIKNIDDAYSEYASVVNSGTASTDELSSSLDGLCNALGISRAELAAAAKEAGSYEAAIREAIKAQKDMRLEQERTAIDAEIQRQQNPAGGNIFSGAIAWVRDQVLERNRSNTMTDIGRDALVSSSSDYTYEDFMTEVLGVPPKDIEQAASDVTYWLDKIDDLQSHLNKIKETSKWGEKDWRYKLGSEFKTYIESDIATLQDLTSSYNQGLVSSIFSSEDIQASVKNLDELQNKVKSFGLTLNDVVFGNINTGNRQILEWNDSNLKKYEAELKSWGETAESMRGSVSTVLGSSAEYDGIEIAFSPILQTSDGPILLGSNTVDKYISSLIAKLGKGWTNEQLLELDAKGMSDFTVQGHVVKGLIADIGDTAIQTGEAMHYLGNNGAVAEQFDEIRQAMIDAVMADDGFVGGIEDAEAAVDAFLSSSDGLVSFYNDLNSAMELSSVAMTKTAKGLKGISELSKRSTDAFKELDELLKGDTDYDSNQKKRIEYYQTLLDEFKEGNFGGMQYQALAKEFGVDITGSIEQQKEAIAGLARYYSDLDQGMANFLNDIDTKVPDAVADFNDATGKLQWDPTKFKEIADYLGISEDMLADMMNTFKMGVTPADWIDLSPEMLAGWLEADGILSGTTVNMSKLESIASNYGYDVDQLVAKLKTIPEYADLTEIKLNVDPTDVDSAVEYIQAALSNVQVGDVNTIVERIVAALADVPNEQTAIEILGKLNLDEETFNKVAEQLNESHNFNIETTEAKSAIIDVKSQLEDLNNYIDVVNKNGTVEIKVTDNGTINELQKRIYALISSSISLIGSIEPTKVKERRALGTKNSSGGLALLGDEFSASGNPKPELVVSNGSAYLAGVNGPVVRNLNPGDIVYTYSQTKKILNNNIGRVSGIPAYAGGVNMSTAVSSKKWDGSSKSNSSNDSNGNGYQNSNDNSDKDAKNWFEIQYELHNHYRKMDKETDAKYFKWLAWAHKKAYGEALFEVEEYHKYQEELRQLQKDMLSQMVEDKKHQVTMGKLSDEKYYKWLYKAAKKWYKKGKINAEEYRKYEEEVYNGLIKVQQEKIKNAIEAKKHQVAMDELSDEKYYKWLDKASKKWYKKGKISLDDYRKYQEEVYSGIAKVIEEKIRASIDLKKWEIAMNKRTEASYYKWLAKNAEQWYAQQKIDAAEYRKYREEIYNGELALFDDYLGDLDHRIEMLNNANIDSSLLSKQGLEAVEKEIAAARKQGLNNNDEYVQKLQKKWWTYYNQLTDKQKEELDNQLNNLKDFYAKQKDLLKEQQDEDKYLEERAEKRKKVADLESKISQLQYDNSLWATKQRIKLAQELSDARKELDDFEKDHAIQNAEDMYDKLEELQTKHIEKQKEISEDNKEQVDIAPFDAGGNPKNQGGIEYAAKLDAAMKQLGDKTIAFNNAKAALDAAYKAEEQARNNASIVAGAYATKKDALALAKFNYKHNKTKKNKKAVTTASNAEKKAKTAYDNAVKAAENANNALKAAEQAYVLAMQQYEQAQQNVAVVQNGFASGTRNATPGIHRINEHGDEAVFSTNDGKTYKLFSGGEHVFTHSATDFLHDFADNPSVVLSDILKNVSVNAMPSLSGKNVAHNISLGNIIINGDASEKTISAIRREQRSQVDYMLKELNRLNK